MTESTDSTAELTARDELAAPRPPREAANLGGGAQPPHFPTPDDVELDALIEAAIAWMLRAADDAGRRAAYQAFLALRELRDPAYTDHLEAARMRRCGIKPCSR